jgi:hypothetical protein
MTCMMTASNFRLFSNKNNKPYRVIVNRNYSERKVHADTDRWGCNATCCPRRNFCNTGKKSHAMSSMLLYSTIYYLFIRTTILFHKHDFEFLKGVRKWDALHHFTPPSSTAPPPPPPPPPLSPPKHSSTKTL